MKGLFTRNTTEEPSGEPSAQSEDSFDELRKILVGPLQTQFEEMREMMKAQGLHPEDVSEILAEAIMIRSSRDDQIVKAMEPITEEAIKASVQKNPRVLVDVFVPVMLPAIKKAITRLIKEMVQSFSATLEHGLSMRGLKWRFEAFKTKKPFGEVALLHSLVYRVEQVFLIHKDTGLVIQHLEADEVISQDPDMVSAMLTAIQDFVRDSFGGGQDEGLENLEFGDRSVWIEQTSHIVLAAVVWGNAPVELRKVLDETVTAIQFEHIDALRTFDGDTAPFESAKERLSDCLRSQVRSEKQKSIILWTLAVLLAGCIGYGSFLFVRDYIRWTDYLDKLHKEPGIVITEAERKISNYFVFGLRDPLSTDPVELLRESKLDPDKVKFDWELYHSSHPDFIVRRIRSILSPPETIALELKKSILFAEGAASHQWITDAEKLAETIPGIMGFQSDGVSVIETKNIEVTKKKIEDTVFFFDSVSTKIRIDYEGGVEGLVEDIKEMDRLMQVFGKNFRVEITGHTDSIGSDKRNAEISQKRAEELFSLLTSGGIRPEIFTVRGVGSKEPLREEVSDADREFNRCVSFKVIVEDKQSGSEKTESDLSVEQSSSEESGKSSEPAQKEGAEPDPRSEQIKTDDVEFGPL